MILITNNEGECGIDVTTEMLAKGHNCLDAIEAGIRLVEDSLKVRTVGRGGWPNLIGEVELDASVMDGTTLSTGSVGALKGFLHPVSVARQIKERLPHEILVGSGAARFAMEIGEERSENLIPDSKAAWDEWFETAVDDSQKSAWPNVPLAALCRHAIDPEIGHDTTIFIGQDIDGNIAAGTSTSGWGWKYPGRLGDSPIIGSGSYADSRYGACACTGAGEMTIRTGTARSVVLYLKMGFSVEEAVYEAVNDMRALSCGLISRVTIHAIDTKGRHKVIAINGNSENTYCIWSENHKIKKRCAAEIIVISTNQSKPTASLQFAKQRL